jgi:fused signal recognition particle receptor
MFDNLKESLGSFREDVEEEAEVEAADDEPESDGAAGETAAEDTGEGADATGGSAEAAAGDDAVAADDDGGDENPGLGQRAKSLATGKVYIDEDDLEGPLRDLEFAMLENDVEMSVAEAVTDRLREDLVGERKAVTTRTGSVVEDALRDALLDVLSVGQFDLVDRIEATDGPAVVVFTGVNGVGKTTSIAKLSRYLEEQGYSSVLANGDTFRAGANEQIAEHADNLDRKLISHDRGGDPAAVVYDAVEYAEANDVDVVLGDTAGRLHTDEGLMDQLEKIGRVVDPDLTIFVDEAVAGQDAVNRAREFDEAATVDGAILTKADADASGGAAISVAHVTGKPILFLGVGQGYDDLERFDPEEMVDRLLA